MVKNSDLIGVLTFAGGWTLGTLATLIIGLVMWDKYRCHRLNAGDYFLCGAWVITTAFLFLTTWTIVSEGAGRHEEGVSRTQVDLLAKVEITRRISATY